METKSLVFLLLLSACNAPAPELDAPDLTPAATDAGPIAADLNKFDVMPPADLSGPIAPDLAEPAPDLAPACGAIGQPCCDTRVCTNPQTTCMRSEADG